MAQGDQEVTIRIVAKNLTEAEFKKARAQVAGLGREAGKAGKQTKGFTTSFLKLTGSIISAHVAMRLVSAGLREINQFISASIKASSDFDDAFTKSTAIMGNLSETMRTDMVTAAELVAKTTTFSATEAADAYFFLASAGLDAAQSIGALPQVSLFAQAGAFDLARATDLLTDAQSALGMTIKNDAVANMDNMARVSDVLVKANTLANASVEQFSEALTTKAGPALKIVGKDIEEGVSVLAAFADQGVKGAEAGTALNIVLRDLSTKAIKNADAFRANKVAVFDSQGEMRNMADIISDLENRLAGMSDEQSKLTLQQLGFADKSVIFIQTLLGMSDEIRTYEEELRKAGGTTEEVASKQLESFSSGWKLVSNNIGLVLKNLGDFVTQSAGVREAFQFIIDAANDATLFLKKSNEAFKKLATEGLAETMESFAVFFDVVGKGLDVTAKWFKFWWTITKNTLLLFPRLMSDSVAQFVQSTDAAIEATDRLGDVFDDVLAESLPKLAGAIRATGETVSDEVAAINKELSHLDFVGPLQPAIAFLGTFREEFEKMGDPLGDFREHFENLKNVQQEFSEAAAAAAANEALLAAATSAATAAALAAAPVMIIHKGKMVESSAVAKLYGEITVRAYQNSQREADKYGLTVGGLARNFGASTAAMQAAFASFGIQTKSQMKETVKQLEKDFDAIQKSGEATAKDLETAWKKLEKARRDLSGETTEYTMSSNEAILSGTTQMLQTLGTKNKAAAYASAVIGTAEAVVQALRSSPPPGSWILAGINAAMGAAQIAAIASAPAYRTGTDRLDFQEFGTRTPAFLHGREAVIPMGRGHQLAEEIASALARRQRPSRDADNLGERFERIGAKLEALPRSIQRAVRDGMLLAS